MKKRTKNKIKTKKTVRARKPQAKKYEAHYLAIFLIAFVLLEGCLITTTNSTDWQRGLAVLDVSSGVSQTISDTATVFQPITTTVEDVNQFYALATDQMTQLLDLSNSDPMSSISYVADGVNQFYQQASIQMAQLLDASSSLNPWPGNVAGVSTTVH